MGAKSIALAQVGDNTDELSLLKSQIELLKESNSLLKQEVDELKNKIPIDIGERIPIPSSAISLESAYVFPSDGIFIVSTSATPGGVYYTIYSADEAYSYSLCANTSQGVAQSDSINVLKGQKTFKSWISNAGHGYFYPYVYNE